MSVGIHFIVLFCDHAVSVFILFLFYSFFNLSLMSFSRLVENTLNWLKFVFYPNLQTQLMHQAANGVTAKNSGSRTVSMLKMPYFQALIANLQVRQTNFSSDFFFSFVCQFTLILHLFFLVSVLYIWIIYENISKI